MLGEALTAEDDAAVLQELEELEGKEAQAEASELPSVPQVPCMPTPCPQRVPLPPLCCMKLICSLQSLQGRACSSGCYTS